MQNSTEHATQYSTEHKSLTFLHPLNERLRFFLRLSYLFQQAKHSINGTSIYDSHNTLRSILDIMTFVNQIDLKKEVLKELERINQKLSPLQDSPEIKHGTLSSILSSIDKLHTELHAINGPIAQELRDNDFLKVVHQRANIAAGFSEFDPPVYCHWLMQPAEIRIADLTAWLSCFESLYTSIALILNLIRESATPKTLFADNGNYQQTLDSKLPYQMLIINLPFNSPYYAEVSGGKHRFTIRFMDTTVQPRPAQTGNRVEFQLSSCAL
jgi:cell division protein ZapD